MDKVFLFPGQGSQYIGMGNLLYKKLDFAKNLYKNANDILDCNIRDISFTDKNSVLNQTQYTQPAIFIYSIILDFFLKDCGYVPEAVAGHSLGEYSALVSANIISFEDALIIIKERSSKMNKLGESEPGKMAAVLNTNISKLTDLINSYNGRIVIANFNTEEQVIISGNKDSINEFIQNSKKNNIRKVIPLNVSGAFHSPLMKKARIYLEKFIKSTKFHDSKIPIYQNVCPEKNFNGKEIKKNILAQLDKPVDWLKTIKNMKNDGFNKFIEVGPKSTLTNFNKAIIPNCLTLSSEKTKDFINIHE